MTNEERMQQIQEAISLIEEAQELIDEAVIGSTEYSSYYAYGRYGLDQLLGNGNPYDNSLYDMLESIRAEENINQ